MKNLRSRLFLGLATFLAALPANSFAASDLVTGQMACSRDPEQVLLDGSAASQGFVYNLTDTTAGVQVGIPGSGVLANGTATCTQRNDELTSYNNDGTNSSGASLNSSFSSHGAIGLEVQGAGLFTQPVFSGQTEIFMGLPSPKCPPVSGGTGYPYPNSTNRFLYFQWDPAAETVSSSKYSSIEDLTDPSQVAYGIATIAPPQPSTSFPFSGCTSDPTTTTSYFASGHYSLNGFVSSGPQKLVCGMSCASGTLTAPNSGTYLNTDEAGSILVTPYPGNNLAALFRTDLNHALVGVPPPQTPLSLTPSLSSLPTSWSGLLYDTSVSSGSTSDTNVRGVNLTFDPVTNHFYGNALEGPSSDPTQTTSDTNYALIIDLSSMNSTALAMGFYTGHVWKGTGTATATSPSAPTSCASTYTGTSTNPSATCPAPIACAPYQFNEQINENNTNTFTRVALFCVGADPSGQTGNPWNLIVMSRKTPATLGTLATVSVGTTVVTGTTAKGTLQLSNSGTRRAPFGSSGGSGISFPGTTNFTWTTSGVTNPCPQSSTGQIYVEAGQTCNVAISYTPPASATQTMGTQTITTGINVDVTGNGMTASATGTVKANLLIPLRWLGARTPATAFYGSPLDTVASQFPVSSSSVAITPSTSY